MIPHAPNLYMIFDQEGVYGPMGAPDLFHILPNISDVAYIWVVKARPGDHVTRWFRKDLTPVLNEDVPAILKAQQLLINP